MMENVLTVDVEEWFHVCGIEKKVPREKWDTLESRVEFGVQRVLDLLDRHQVKGTFFVLGYVTERHPELVRKIAAAGHEVGSHGYWHQKVFEQTPAEFEADVTRSRNLLRDVLGEAPRCYRAPEWSIDRPRRWAYDVLARLGFSADSSVMPMTWVGGSDLEREPFSYPTRYGPLQVFPATSMRLFWENLPFTGGLSFRVSPYWYTVYYMERLNRQGIPGMVYLHPWEFDHEQPKLPLGPVIRFMHGFNLSAVARNTEGLLRHLPFSTLSDVLEKVVPIPEPAVVAHSSPSFS